MSKGKIKLKIKTKTKTKTKINKKKLKKKNLGHKLIECLGICFSNGAVMDKASKKLR